MVVSVINHRNRIVLNKYFWYAHLFLSYGYKYRDIFSPTEWQISMWNDRNNINQIDERNTLTVLFYWFIKPNAKLSRSRCIGLKNTTNQTSINGNPEDTVLRSLIKRLPINPKKTPDHLKLYTITQRNNQDNCNPGRLNVYPELLEKILIVWIIPRDLSRDIRIDIDRL